MAVILSSGKEGLNEIALDLSTPNETVMITLSA